MIEWAPALLFIALCGFLLFGFPVAFTLAGVALAGAGIGLLTDTFDPAFLHATPNRVFGILSNQILLAVPLFVFMGVMLERSKIAESLLNAMSQALKQVKGGLALSVILVGALLAASTGIIGATVVTMGLITLPAMLKQGYKPDFAAGVICATGTLGQIIPPSIALILLGDVLSSAYQNAQLQLGIFNPKTLSVRDLFMGALVPGVMLALLYGGWVLIVSRLKPDWFPQTLEASKQTSSKAILKALLPPLGLIFVVLGSIVLGVATPTEAAALGAMGATFLAAAQKTLTTECLRAVAYETVKVTSMVFMIFIGAAVFSLVFRGFHGDEWVQGFFTQLPGGQYGALALVMLIVFLLGFILDFIEITFVVLPIVAPALFLMGIDPVWLGILIALNLQTSFLTPPFGFALFYLRGVAPPELNTTAIYKGAVPFIGIQVLAIIVVILWPALITYLPSML
jgi:tripartite ATP-independent transporter DctM subunit